MIFQVMFAAEGRITARERAVKWGIFAALKFLVTPQTCFVEETTSTLARIRTDLFVTTSPGAAHLHPISYKSKIRLNFKLLLQKIVFVHSDKKHVQRNGWIVLWTLERWLFKEVLRWKADEQLGNGQGKEGSFPHSYFMCLSILPLRAYLRPQGHS